MRHYLLVKDKECLQDSLEGISTRTRAIVISSLHPGSGDEALQLPAHRPALPIVPQGCHIGVDVLQHEDRHQIGSTYKNHMSRRFHIFHHVILQSATDLCHGDPSLDLN